MNNAIEMLFEDFLNAPMDGELAEAMHFELTGTIKDDTFQIRLVMPKASE